MLNECASPRKPELKKNVLCSHLRLLDPILQIRAHIRPGVSREPRKIKEGSLLGYEEEQQRGESKVEVSVGGMGEGDSNEGGEGNKDRRKREGDNAGDV